MNLTVNHLTQTVFNEFSRRKINKFSIKELSRTANLSRSTIYYYFEDINQVYKEVFYNIVLKEITDGCTSTDDFIKRTVNYIEEHKNFCLNLYYLTSLWRNHQHAINLLSEILPEIEGYEESNNYNAITSYICTIDDWFKEDLSRSKEVILGDLLTI